MDWNAFGKYAYRLIEVNWGRQGFDNQKRKCNFDKLKAPGLALS